MNRRRSGKVFWTTLSLVAIVTLVVGIVIFEMHRRPPRIILYQGMRPAPATTTTQASSKPAQPNPRDLLTLLRANDPEYPTTQELEIPGNYDQAAHIVLDQPVYLCPLGHLWITDPRGKPVSAALGEIEKTNSHVVRDAVVFIHWKFADRKWNGSAVRKNADGGFELVQAARTTPLGIKRKWSWDRALTFEDKIVVPTDRGVSIFDLSPPPVLRGSDREGADAVPENYQPLADDAVDISKLSAPVVLFDTHGILVWMPWETGKTGSHGAARFADGKWTKLDASQNWPDKILQLVPLLDGSVVQLIPGENDSVTLRISGVARDAAKIDEAAITQLVGKLSDPDQVNRDAAYEELTRYGPGIFPLLQKLQENQPPAAQSRIQEILRSKLNLTLGPITLEPGPVTTAQRLRDGGVVLYCDSGVSVARGSSEKPNLIAPAWLSLRPGYPVQVLSPRLTDDLTPGKQKIWAFKGEWIVGDQVQGLRWFVGNYLSPLENKDEYNFDEFVGIDNHGRWIMREAAGQTRTLIVDPNLPDTTPRLPVWPYKQQEGVVGWTNTNWPAVKPNGVVVLDATAWRDPKSDETFYEHEADMPAPATAPTSAPATSQEADLILVDADGTRYFDGSNQIRVKTPDGKRFSYDLPATATGNGDVWLFHTAGRFFLFNQPGRVVRLRRTPGAPEPFAVEQIFTHNIPSVDGGNTWIDRIWLDPAGRIDIATNGHMLSILFPAGQVPPEIRQMMPPDSDRE